MVDTTIDSNQLVELFSLSQSFLRPNLDGISHEESTVAPRPAGNCANWILGHIVYWRNEALKLAGGEPLWDEREGEVYDGRGENVFTLKDAMNWERLVSDSELAHQRLTACFEVGLPESPDAAQSLASVLVKLQVHETYHVGQLGVIRRTLGKSGAFSR